MKKLERNIIRFVRSIEPSIKVVFHDGAWESDIIGKQVFVNIDDFFFSFTDENEHLEIMRENGFVVDVMLPTYILLHEVGHIMSAKNYKRSPMLMLDEYEKSVNGLVKHFRGLELLRKYKALKLERDADRYAYDYYIHNYKKVKALDSAIQEITA
jgi:hypothetical protein